VGPVGKWPSEIRRPVPLRGRVPAAWDFPEGKRVDHVIPQNAASCIRGTATAQPQGLCRGGKTGRSTGPLVVCWGGLLFKVSGLRARENRADVA